ncbi:hypothetical protein BJV77DRAFT_961987 [Russula vinacea]|nr:hypothetical protein BJV77DRAFT_961987 [Russula vinacea]
MSVAPPQIRGTLLWLRVVYKTSKRNNSPAALGHVGEMVVATFSRGSQETSGVKCSGVATRRQNPKDERRRRVVIAACVAGAGICAQYATLLVSLVEEEDEDTS